ncbi:MULTISPECIES: BrnT family toxin [unclassified Haematospirillum]|uniref:BrnT family toxin n=1 Tax=unclassified Haematospirillum TaxID=2622088 RepID=UPI00143BDB39|nr:BrnT family toxin [Haematospirillum sp. H4890]NKD75243.1 BrnT family toxin [Haematospirillum sp. H4485]
MGFCCNGAASAPQPLKEAAVYGEQRLITVGYMDGRMVVMVWTPRRSAYRIISLRKANAREEKRFQPRLGG